MSRCEWASCSFNASRHDQGWDFCGNHYRMHLALMRPDPDDDIPANEGRPVDRPEQADLNDGHTLNAVRDMRLQGYSDTQIGHQLHLGRKTVAAYRRAAGLPPLRGKNAPRHQPCGTRHGRNLHRERGETPCQPCVDADRAYHRENERRRRLQT